MLLTSTTFLVSNTGHFDDNVRDDYNSQAVGMYGTGDFGPDCPISLVDPSGAIVSTYQVQQDYCYLSGGDKSYTYISGATLTFENFQDAQWSGDIPGIWLIDALA